MAYAAASDVAALCKNILAGASNFSAATCPTLDAVEEWLSSGCAVIETHLRAHGYQGADLGTAAYGWLGDLNALYAAARVELSRTNLSLAPGERTRGQVFDEMFWRGLNRLSDLLEGDMTEAGLVRSGTAPELYVGGVSESDKLTWDTDTDRVRPRFYRGMLGFPGTALYESTTSAS